MKKFIAVIFLGLFLFAFGVVEANHDPPDGVDQIVMIQDNVSIENPAINTFETIEVQGVTFDIGKSYELNTNDNEVPGYLCNYLLTEYDEFILSGNTLKHSYLLTMNGYKYTNLTGLGHFPISKYSNLTTNE